MQLVIRNDQKAADEAVPAQAHMPSKPADDPALQDAAGEEKRRAAERLQKLRNLSFNLHSADSNNEFDSVPAYIRRNMELQSNQSSVENFYSNYTVQPDGTTARTSQRSIHSWTARSRTDLCSRSMPGRDFSLENKPLIGLLFLVVAPLRKQRGFFVQPARALSFAT
jgi:hypothetical protein